MKAMLCLLTAGLALSACAPDAGTGRQDKAASAAGGDGWRPQWGEPDAALLRPGRQTSQDEGYCTAGFLFVDPVRQLYYLGSAAHCVGGRELAGEPHDGTGTRVVLEEGDFGEIGTVVFDSDDAELREKFGVEDRVDFALIELDPDINLIAHPQLVSLPGPTGLIQCAETATGDGFDFHGYGAGFGRVEQTRARTGVLTYCDGDVFGGYSPAVFGDSGAAAIHQASGAALGMFSGIEVNQIPPQSINGATLPFILRELRKAGFGDVSLATSDGGYVGGGAR